MTATRENNFAFDDLKKKLFENPFSFKLINPDYLEEIAQDIITLTKVTYDAIAALTNDKINFETAIQPLINLKLYVQKSRALCTFMKEVHPNETCFFFADKIK